MLFSLIQKISETKESPYDFFRYCETKIFQRKPWYPPPIHKIFRQKNVSEKFRVPLRNLLVLWEIQFSTKSWYTILCNFFNPEIFWKERVLRGIFSVLWDKKVSRESRDFPLLSIKFFDKRTFLKKEGFSYEKFWYCEKINFRQNRDTLSYANFFNAETFSIKRVTLGIFSVLWDKMFRENVVISPSYPESFSIK